MGLLGEQDTTVLPIGVVIGLDEHDLLLYRLESLAANYAVGGHLHLRRGAHGSLIHLVASTAVLVRGGL